MFLHQVSHPLLSARDALGAQSVIDTGTSIVIATDIKDLLDLPNQKFIVPLMHAGRALCSRAVTAHRHTQHPVMLVNEVELQGRYCEKITTTFFKFAARA